MENKKEIYIAKNLSDVIYHLKNIEGIQVIGAGTQPVERADKCVTIRFVPELKHIEKKERYIDFGSAVTLSKALALGKDKMPSVLYEALETIGTDGIRNIGTLGGNISSHLMKLTLYAPLLALNAKLEFRTQNETKLIPFSKIDMAPPKSVLTKIRVPIDEWEVSIFKRVGPTGVIGPLSASFAFLVASERGMISEVRIVFAGAITWTSQDIENKIIGTRLPISEKFVDYLIEASDEIYMANEQRASADPLLRAQFLNLLRNSLEQLM